MADIKYGINYLFHGPGGCGKTSALIKLALPGKIAYTAATGIASLNLPNGSTLHRWAGIGLGRESADALASNISRVAAMRWNITDILVIDEIGMIGATLFDKLDYIGRKIRGYPDLPFGGLMLILSGDFLQLSPINDRWIFTSKVWKQLNLEIVKFTNMVRFNDVKYFEMLLRARKGNITDEDVEMLRECTRELEGDIKPTVLYSRKTNVNELNINELNKLPGEEYVIESVCTNIAPKDAETMFDIPHFLRLKEGAQVMLRVNLGDGLVNGSRGVVVKVLPTCIVVKFNSGVSRIERHTWERDESRKIFTMKQFPIILAWAITIHKSQGATLDKVKCDLGHSIFTAGQAYIALSRIRNFESMQIEHLNRKRIFADKEALEYVESIEN